MKRLIPILLILSLILSGCSFLKGDSNRSSRRDRDDDDGDSGISDILERRSAGSETTSSTSSTTSDRPDVTTGTDVIDAPSDVYSFTMEPMYWDEAIVGSVAVPEGYTGETIINYCDETTCLSYPIRVSEVLTRNDDNALLLYKCGEGYIQRISGYFSHEEGALDQQLYVFMKTYQDAAATCDEIAATIAPDAVYVSDEDMSLYNNALTTRDEEYHERLVSGQVPGMTLDWEELTAAQRVYSYNIDGMGEYAICVACEVRGYQITTEGYGYSDTLIIWDIPGYYLMVCPMDEYRQNHDTIFQMFIDNTNVNDQFIDANDAIATEIMTTVINNWNMQCAASSAYAQAMTAMTFASVESAMSADNYSSDRFSDYIFDQNDYTLSDGSSVQISTAYDYVYEGSNGVVYYSNSAFDQPGGSTQLYPN